MHKLLVCVGSEEREDNNGHIPIYLDQSFSPIYIVIIGIILTKNSPSAKRPEQQRLITCKIDGFFTANMIYM